MAQPQKQKRPQFINGIRVKAPEDYDFNTWGKDFSEYNKEYKLRTDAVWQKQMLRNWYRCSNKPFFFNRKKKKYYMTEPQDMYSTVLEPWGIEDSQVFQYQGTTRTGTSPFYQISIGAKQRVQSTFNSFYSMPDYYIMCAMRFQKWFKCDSVYSKQRDSEFDLNPNKGIKHLQIHQAYPCYRQWYETTYACNDNPLKFLIQLAYAKKSQNFFQENTSSVQIRSFPIAFDSPTEPERTTYTY